MDSTDISLLPALNPDGWDLASEGECSGTGRGSGAANDNGVDINTDFPGPEAGGDMLSETESGIGATFIFVDDKILIPDPRSGSSSLLT